MATCNDCYGTNTAQPCASVGCLSTNYAKCISYSGSNLFCQSGAIATFTFTGTAVAPITDTTVVASATGGSGADATFTVVRRAGTTVYEVTLDDVGAAYEVSDVLTIAGTSVGGVSPLNDISITVTTLAAVIANGDSLDTVIQNFNNRLCLVSASSPSGLDYTAFNYQCLRVGGNLEGVGTVITTAKAFTEAVASALCSLNTRVKGLELPPIIVDTYFSGSLISGTSTMVEVLNEYGEAIGDVNDKFTVTTSSTCGTFTNLTTLTSKPSPTASLGNWFDWVAGNICTNFTTVDTHITSELSEHIAVNTFLYGVAQSFPTSGARGDNFVDTACLPGGSATSNVRTAIDLIASELCSLKSTVAAGPTSNYTVAWSGCFTAPYTANSVFNAQGLGTFTNTTTLQTHLNQIATALSALNIKFSSDFTVTNSACGPVIGLVGGSTFTCASLASCDLNAMGDVTYNTGSFNSGDILVRNQATSQWINARLRPTIAAAGGVSNTYVPTYNSVSNTLDVNITLPLSNKIALIPSPLAGSWLVQAGPAPFIGDWPLLLKNATSGLVQPYINTGVQLVNNSGGNLTITNNGTVSLLNVVDATYLLPPTPTHGGNVYIPVSVVEKTSGGTLSAIHNCLIKIHSETTTTLTSGSYSIIDLVNVKGSSIVVANGNILDIYFGGISWPIV